MKMALIALVLLIVGAGLIIYRMKNETTGVKWYKDAMGIAGLIAVGLGSCVGAYGLYSKMAVPSYSGLPFVRGM